MPHGVTLAWEPHGNRGVDFALPLIQQERTRLLAIHKEVSHVSGQTSKRSTENPGL